MFIKTLVVTFLFIQLAQAQEVSVSYGLMKYRLAFEAQKAELNGKNLSLSLDRSKCNAEIYDQFKQNVKHSTEVMKLHINASADKVEVISDKKKSYFDRSSPEGKYFLTLPDIFKKNKIKSKLKCAVIQIK